MRWPARLLLALVLLLPATGASAAGPAVQAKALIANGRLDAAAALLERGDWADETERLFLLAEVSRRRGRHDAAIGQYRDILARRPDLARVRLELARTFFLAGDDDNAERQFRSVLGDDPPREVRRNIERFLAQIRRRRGWSLDLALSLAPDSNINAGPTIREVDLFGVPFTLSEEARKSSGIGFTVATGGELRHAVGDDLRLRVGARLERREYAESRFDDSFASAFLGPQRLLAGDRGSASLLAVGFRRWLGKAGFSRALGARAEGDYALSPRLRLAGYLEGLAVTHDDQPSRDGPLLAAGLEAIFGLNGWSGLSLFAAASRERAEARHRRSTSLRAGLGWLGELPLGLTLQLRPEVVLTEFDGRQPLFQADRRDLLLRGSLQIVKRDVALMGFTPVLGYTYTRNDSSIAFYDFDRHRLTLGVTRLF